MAAQHRDVYDAFDPEDLLTFIPAADVAAMAQIQKLPLFRAGLVGVHEADELVAYHSLPHVLYAFHPAYPCAFGLCLPRHDGVPVHTIIGIRDGALRRLQPLPTADSDQLLMDDTAPPCPLHDFLDVRAWEYTRACTAYLPEAMLSVAFNASLQPPRPECVHWAAGVPITSVRIPFLAPVTTARGRKRARALGGVPRAS